MTGTRLALCAAIAAGLWLTACGPTWYSIEDPPAEDHHPGAVHSVIAADVLRPVMSKLQPSQPQN